MDGNDAIIAVVMPVYKGERSLAAAIESVLKQTLIHLELWVVDDGSPDKSGRIMDEYANRDSRVHVIHKSNEGCYHARLAALKKITTPYFAFVDQDDIAEPTLCEELLRFARENDLDIAQCDRVGSKSVGCNPEFYCSRDEIVEGYLWQRLITGGDQVTVWCKLYKNKFDFSAFEDVANVTALEDMIYNFQFFSKAERFGILHKGLYNYIINDGSSVRNFSLRYLNDLREGYRVRQIWLPRYNVASDVAANINAVWFIKNARNTLVSACMSKPVAGESRVDNVNSILKLDELACAMKDVSSRSNRFNTSYLFVRLAQSLPTPIFILIINVFFGAWRLVRR